jgi:metal-responsive CopG/Arc/MetJ family transcriptional regulator
MVSMFSDNNMVGESIKLGITLPKSTVERIDKVRGDVARSRYILRAIESYLITSSGVRAAKGKGKAAKKK